MIQFSDTVGNTGIVQQVRKLMRVDSTQWPTVNIANSVNNWLDFLTGYAIGTDKRFQWDDTNHTKLPEGTTDMTINVSDYSFLTDEQGNSIVTLTGVSRLISGSNYTPLMLIDRNDLNYDPQNFGLVSGSPTAYDKIADNIIRLDAKPAATVTAGLKFFFQRTPSYVTASDTTKSPGFSPLLHRGFIIAAAYDGSLTLGLSNLQPLSVEREKEERKVIQYFADRNNDEYKQMTMSPIRFR